MSKNPLVVIDGQLMPLSEARVPVNDRSFLFGDSIYEVIATRHGKPFFSDDHLQRMRATADGIHFNLPWSNDWFKQQIRIGLDALKLEEVYVRIVLSRGSGDFNIDIDSVQTDPLVVFIFKPLPMPPAHQFEQGSTLAVPETRRNSPRSLNPAFKTGNYLNNLLCLYEAKQKGGEDALILDLDGNITEATTSNFFMVRDGELYTAPLDVGILDGITRRYFIQLAQAHNIPVHQVRYTLDDLAQAQEAFVSSTIKGAMPVRQIDALTYPSGYGPLTQKLNQLYWEYVDEHLDDY